MPNNEIVRPSIFMIEVPKEQRKTFFNRSKDKVEYWAFKNRPRAFYNEKVVFTFDRKPVAETIVMRIEGPGKGEGEYKHWHKVYWHPAHFRKYTGKSAASKWIGPVYHGTTAQISKLQGQPGAAGMTYFTDDTDYANNFATDNGRYKDNSAVYPSYIRFNKPFDARDLDDLDKESFSDAIGADEELPVIMIGSDRWQPFWRWVLYNPDVTKHYLSKQGYDGILLMEAYSLGETPNTNSFIVFNDNQIRSATAEKQPKQLLNLRTGASKPILYHGTRKQFQPGDILTPRSDGYFSDPDTKQHEQIMERNRPEGALPRSQSVYMVDDPALIDRAGGYEDFVYAVEPIGKVEKNDLEWYGQISAYDWEDMENPEANKLAQGYWSGALMGGNWPLFEYRAPQAKILKLVSSSKTAKLAAVQFPTYEQCIDKSTDTNNEFQLDGWGDHTVDGPPEEYTEALAFWQKAKFPLKVYRAIVIGNGEQIHYDDFGISWSLSSDAAKEVVSELHDPDDQFATVKMFQGTITADAVDWLDTFRAWMTLPLEQEVRLKSGAPVKMRGKTVTADEVLDVGDGDEYWAGEGNAASGILAVCPQTGNVCLAMRSKYVMTPNCWGTIGGAVQEGMSPQQSAKAELAEETGYSGGMTLIPAYVFTDRGFSYHNFIGVVASEFKFAPQPYSKEEIAYLKQHLGPKQRYQLNPGWETSHINWIPYQQWVEDMTANPGDYHPGMMKLYHASKDKIEKALKIEPQEQQKTSADKANLTAFMQDLWSQTYGNPFNDAERVWQDKAIIECRPFDGRIHLSLIRSVEKGKGGGTEGLKFLTALADKHGVEIDLGAKPVGKGGLTKSQLVQWYKRHGFNPRRGETSDSLLYQPQERLKLSAVPVEFKEEMRDAHNDQTDMTLRAFVNGEPVGYVDYSVFNDEPSVQYIEVTNKRQGYGTALLRKLQQMFPDTEIDLGMTTPDGTGLVDSLKFKEEPTEYADKMAELEKLIPERDRLQAIADEFYEKESPSDAERQAFMAEMEKMQTIHDRIWELEQETNGKSPVKRLISAKTGAADLPPEPGTASIPAGTVRLYHYTKSRQSFDSIKQQGLLAKFALGDDMSGQGPSAGIWASTRPPGDQHLFVELYLYPEQISHRAEYPRKEDSPEEWAQGYHHVIANGDVPLNQIIAFHEPFHKHVRYLMDGNTWEELMERDPQIVDAASDGSAFSKAPDGEAVRWMAANFGTGKTASFDKIALNIPKLVKDFGQKLVQRYSKENFAIGQGKFAPEQIINQIASEDVTPNKEYTAWITGNYTRGDIPRFEDIGSRVIPALKRFHALKGGRRIPNEERDIGRVKGLRGLEDLVTKYEQVDATSKRQQDASQEQAFYKDGEAELILNDAKFKIVVPKTQQASCYFGINTRWCTAAEKGNMFQTYAQNGPLYIVLVKANNERFQFHFESGQFMDQTDDQIDPDIFFDSYPELAKVFLPIADRSIESAQAVCDQCSGKGKTSCDDCDDGLIKCDFCGGDQEVACAECEGSGEISNEDGGEEEPSEVECPSCAGIGTKTCPECDGHGGSRCSSCDGTAFLECGECNSTGINPFTERFRDAAQTSSFMRDPAEKAQGATASVKTATKYYHGGGDVQGGMLDVRKGQSGAIFVTPDINYAKQYVKTNGGGLYTVDVDESKIFDPENQDHLDQLEQGYLNLVGEDYSEAEDALSDYHHFIGQSPEMMMDWAVAPDAFDAVRTLGYKGMKLRERPGTVSLAEDGFDISGPPITSIALFDNKVPATRIASEWTKKAAGFAFKSFKKLWHVGSMKKMDKQPGSLEGSGLSVSVHPEDWMAIAEIGGDTWELTKQGNKFLSFHRLSKQQREQITAWGIQNGYVTEVQNAFRFVYYDSEADEERYMEFPTEQEAKDEMDGMGEGGQVIPIKSKTVAGTDKLKQRSHNPHADQTAVAFDLLVTVYVEDELDCDGVWWDDTYDPMNLSAPRGVIFPSKLSTWTAKKVQRAKTGSDLSYYTEEGCGIFAVALCQFHPKADIKCISDLNGEAWSEDIPYEMSHVYCSTPSGNFDVNGEHSVESMASALGMSNYRVIGGWSPKQFMDKYMGMGDAHPLYGEPSDVEAARDIILANPQKYGVDQSKIAAAPAQAQMPTLAIPVGTKLYRGIGEDVIHNHAPAADGCLWLTESITIARSYIPTSGVELVTNLRMITEAPQERSGLNEIQKQLGFEYTDVKYEANGRANSYRLPKLMDTLVPEKHPDEKQFTDKNQYWDASHAWQEKRKKALENYVKQKLSELGYESENPNGYSGGDYRLKLDIVNGKDVLLPNKHQEGTVCVFEVVQPLNIYDMTNGGKVEGDLMDPQYREYGKFETIAANGFDGVKIADYAQIEGHGNFGHTSIGLFTAGVPKVKEVERQIATHPEDLYADLKKYGSAKWYHGTSVANAEKIIAAGELRPGMKSKYVHELVPRQDAVYITTHYEIADDNATRGGDEGEVLELAVPNPSNLIPDEDDINMCLTTGPANMLVRYAYPNVGLSKAIHEVWAEMWQGLGEAPPAGPTSAVDWDELMKKAAEYIHEKHPDLSKQIVAATGKAAHIGALKVVGYKTAGWFDKKPPLVIPDKNIRAFPIEYEDIGSKNKIVDEVLPPLEYEDIGAKRGK